MKRNYFLAPVLLAVLLLSALALAQGPGAPPSGPTGPDMGQGPGTPPSGPPDQNMDNNGTRPLKERLEEFYADKETYINQKRQCKEYAAANNVEKGYCWDKLKPLMVGLLLKEVMLTEKRLLQLRDRNIVFSDFNEISSKLADAKAIFADKGASKELLKSTAKSMEELINQIEEKATWNQAGLLITQMDNLMVKADALVAKLDAKLGELKAAGTDVGQLESALLQFKEDLAKTKENIAKAKAKYADTNSAEELSQLAKEIRSFVNDAKNNLEKAIDRAKKIVPAMDKSEKGGKIQPSDLSPDDLTNGPQGGTA